MASAKTPQAHAPPASVWDQWVASQLQMADHHASMKERVEEARRRRHVVGVPLLMESPARAQAGDTCHTCERSGVMMNAPRVRQRSEEAAAGSLFNGSSSAAALLDVPLIEAAERCAHALTTRNEGTYSLYASREGTCNWARNVVYSAPRVLYPATIQELGDLVRCAKKCRGLGSRHSFSRVADTTGDLISPMMAGISINAKARTVRCGAGTTYAALAQQHNQQFGSG